MILKICKLLYFINFFADNELKLSLLKRLEDIEKLLLPYNPLIISSDQVLKYDI